MAGALSGGHSNPAMHLPSLVTYRGVSARR